MRGRARESRAARSVARRRARHLHAVQASSGSARLTAARDYLRSVLTRADDLTARVTADAAAVRLLDLAAFAEPARVQWHRAHADRPSARARVAAAVDSVRSAMAERDAADARQLADAAADVLVASAEQLTGGVQ